MKAESFLNEELKKIDLGVSQKKRSFSFPEFPLVDLLPYITSEEIFFFESKEEDFTFLGLGKSKELDLAQADEFLKNHPQVFLSFQGMFEEKSKSLCYLPEWCFIKRQGKIELTIFDSLEYLSASPSNLMFHPSVWESFLEPWTSYEESPESDEWSEMIAQATNLFSNKTLEKIVLSRKKVFTYEAPIEMLVMFRELYQANLQSSHFSIYHQLNYGESFISFTPERLFTLKNKNLETISLAGSTPRGEDEKSDALLEEELKNSDKLIREHGLVTEEIKKKLSSVLDSLSISDLFTMKLPYIQHRQAKITGTLKEETSPLDLVALMHPTAAVGGLPYSEAKEKILEIEKEKRNYYAAPVGIIGKDFSEVAVGIRSAFIKENKITVYGGAGIVMGSIAEEEWIETGAKMQPFTKVLNKSII